jgi:hypothetical protein
MQETSSGSLLSGFKEASKVCIKTLLPFEQQPLNPWLRSCDNMLSVAGTLGSPQLTCISIEFWCTAGESYILAG